LILGDILMHCYKRCTWEWTERDQRLENKGKHKFSAVEGAPSNFMKLNRLVAN
jgi:hypothetical protein